jgi:hypothetical protein
MMGGQDRKVPEETQKKLLLLRQKFADLGNRETPPTDEEIRELIVRYRMLAIAANDTTNWFTLKNGLAMVGHLEPLVGARKAPAKVESKKDAPPPKPRDEQELADFKAEVRRAGNAAKVG